MSKTTRLVIHIYFGVLGGEIYFVYSDERK